MPAFGTGFAQTASAGLQSGLAGYNQIEAIKAEKQRRAMIEEQARLAQLEEGRRARLFPVQLDGARESVAGQRQSREQGAELFPITKRGAELGNTNMEESTAGLVQARENAAELFPVQLDGARAGVAQSRQATAASRSAQGLAEAAAPGERALTAAQGRAAALSADATAAELDEWKANGWQRQLLRNLQLVAEASGAQESIAAAPARVRTAFAQAEGAEAAIGQAARAADNDDARTTASVAASEAATQSTRLGNEYDAATLANRLVESGLSVEASKLAVKGARFDLTLRETAGPLEILRTLQALRSETSAEEFRAKTRPAELRKLGLSNEQLEVATQIAKDIETDRQADRPDEVARNAADTRRANADADRAETDAAVASETSTETVLATNAVNRLARDTAVVELGLVDAKGELASVTTATASINAKAQQIRDQRAADGDDNAARAELAEMRNASMATAVKYFSTRKQDAIDFMEGSDSFFIEDGEIGDIRMEGGTMTVYDKGDNVLVEAERGNAPLSFNASAYLEQYIANERPLTVNGLKTDASIREEAAKITARINAEAAAPMTPEKRIELEADVVRLVDSMMTDDDVWSPDKFSTQDRAWVASVIVREGMGGNALDLVAALSDLSEGGGMTKYLAGKMDVSVPDIEASIKAYSKRTNATREEAIRYIRGRLR